MIRKLVSVPAEDLRLFVQNTTQKIKIFGVGSGPQFWVCGDCGERSKEFGLPHTIKHHANCGYIRVAKAENALRESLDKMKGQNG